MRMRFGGGWNGSPPRWIAAGGDRQSPRPSACREIKAPIACWALQELVSRSPLRSVGNPPLAHAFALAGGIGESAIRALRQLLEQLLRFSESPGIELRDSGFK